LKERAVSTTLLTFKRPAKLNALAVTACLNSVTRGMVPTNDIRKGINSFLERRTPVFTGH
jgi:hypothetical protein